MERFIWALLLMLKMLSKGKSSSRNGENRG
jgi:hypothetical protein